LLSSGFYWLAVLFTFTGTATGNLVSQTLAVGHSKGPFKWACRIPGRYEAQLAWQEDSSLMPVVRRDL